MKYPYITGGVAPVRSPACGPPRAESGKRSAQRSLPPHGAQPEHLHEGEGELERARR
jgi:hypothetical protein